jgi:hypothetical protein
MATLALISRTNPLQVGRVLGLLDDLANLVGQCEQDLRASATNC